MPSCIFCRISAGEVPSDVVWQDHEFVAFRDLRPVAPVHVLLIPRRHLASLGDATGADADLLGRLMLAVPKVAQAVGIAGAGFRTIVNTGSHAGQSVFHLHVHVLGGAPMGWP